MKYIVYTDKLESLKDYYLLLLLLGFVLSETELIYMNFLKAYTVPYFFNVSEKYLIILIMSLNNRWSSRRRQQSSSLWHDGRILSTTRINIWNIYYTLMSCAIHQCITTAQAKWKSNTTRCLVTIQQGQLLEMVLKQGICILVTRGWIMGNMQSAMWELTLGQATLYGIISIQLLVSVLALTTLPLFPNFNKSLMLIGTPRMLFLSNRCKKLILIQAGDALPQQREDADKLRRCTNFFGSLASAVLLSAFS